MHGSAVFALIVRFVRDRGAAEDLWQETFFAASEAARRGETPETPAAWLRTIATRKVVDHLRRTAVRPALNGGLNIISAPLGAYLLSVLPMQGILGIDVTTALLAISIVFFTPIPQPERGANAASTFWQDFREGFRYIMAWRGLVILLGLVMVINFFFSAIEPLTPLLITNHFKGDASDLGW